MLNVSRIQTARHHQSSDSPTYLCQDHCDQCSSPVPSPGCTDPEASWWSLICQIWRARCPCQVSGSPGRQDWGGGEWWLSATCQSGSRSRSHHRRHPRCRGGAELSSGRISWSDRLRPPDWLTGKASAPWEGIGPPALSLPWNKEHSQVGTNWAKCPREFARSQRANLGGDGRWDFLHTRTDWLGSFGNILPLQSLLGFSVPAATNTAPALSDLGGTGEITRQHQHWPQQREFICQAGPPTPGRTQFLIHFMMEIKFLRPPPSPPLTIINTVANSSESQTTAAHLTLTEWGRKQTGSWCNELPVSRKNPPTLSIKDENHGFSSRTKRITHPDQTTQITVFVQ